MPARCLSDALARATIRPEPFPHMVVPDALDPSLYRQLCASFPPFARIGLWKDGPVSRIDAHELPTDRVECVATIPYRPNLLVFLPQASMPSMA